MLSGVQSSSVYDTAHRLSSSGVARQKHGVLSMIIIISIMAICARCNRDKEQRLSNQRSLEMSERESSYEPLVVETPTGSKLEARGAVV